MPKHIIFRCHFILNINNIKMYPIMLFTYIDMSHEITTQNIALSIDMSHMISMPVYNIQA